MTDRMTKSRLLAMTDEVNDWAERFVTAGLSERQREMLADARRMHAETTGMTASPSEDAEILRRIRERGP